MPPHRRKGVLHRRGAGRAAGMRRERGMQEISAGTGMRIPIIPIPRSNGRGERGWDLVLVLVWLVFDVDGFGDWWLAGIWNWGQ